MILTAHEMTDSQIRRAIAEAYRKFRNADTDAVANAWSARLDTLITEQESRD